MYPDRLPDTCDRFSTLPFPRLAHLVRLHVRTVAHRVVRTCVIGTDAACPSLLVHSPLGRLHHEQSARYSDHSYSERLELPSS